MSVRTENLSFSAEEKKILKSISIECGDGLLYGVAGPNGSGKTTLLRLLSKLLLPEAGEVFIDGEKMDLLSDRERAKKVSLVPQIFQAEHSFSVEETVMMGRYPHLSFLENPDAKDEEMVEVALEKTGLLSLRKRKITTLSGGELQRVLLAQALSQNAPLFLLDEPVSHLDIFYQMELLDLLKGLCATEHFTVVCVIHDLNLILKYCDKTILLKDGEVFSKGDTRAVLTKENMQEVYRVPAEIFSKEDKEWIVFG